MFMLEDKEFTKIKEMCKENQEFANAYNMILEEKYQELESINHEFKNYFALILGTAQLMETKDEALLKNPHWMQMVGDIKELYELLEQFSLYSTCDETVWKPMNLQYLIKNIFQHFHAVCIMKEIEMELEIEESVKETSKTFVTDYIKLKEIMVNLIKNATEAVAVGGKIVVRLEKENADTLKISVKNNGRMMTEEEKEGLFETKFISKKGRHGLGLPLCAKFTAMLNGSIQVESTEKETSFEIYLPIVD